MAPNKTAKHINGLLEISRAITSDIYLEDILGLIVTVTASVMHSKICSLMLLNKENELEVKATQSISPAYKRKPNLKMGEGIAGLAALENTPIQVSDVRKDPRYLNRELAKKEKLCSLLSVPISLKGKVKGVINCYTSQPHRFSKEEISLLQTVANQAAVAIENTELMVETKVIYEELETRKIVERAKDILMRKIGACGSEAFRMIQKQSMDNRKPMREVAEAIILAESFHKV
ncbi:histidine kinase [candidate division WOR-1 bacterium RIFOXYA12_FULL_52_29]|uniref:Histidine kinase n=1 Tax=candidate division WOR-1 bacterium RIFOXYC12_FULL_54_18 TaxID=1802584 RepID=A0A1F4T828_UNCSA|nr:MAG: histidine kinase [candidate division WOR-1 bacterium RIFOXYA2_FULL_51_19]OGC18273.1 MAG: histidine kinase [candidate division WOR-1 bacterium RIFOXYA12_FULL_52_29]OGC27128.1 MAG: histidine kinase [candidate division WOR-1 bacterium RIFOXYB2_FULL_45_9]OGC28690.1 MAG: histidine kinase [candidate division WOR-1 bacterium RIFOXYC12_FULL_54_18]OGC30855.1 MAG: histidine kinase [candidate division WOR-1 bacterium RIFOXYB12_FULL_52_16]